MCAVFEFVDGFAICVFQYKTEKGLTMKKATCQFRVISSVTTNPIFTKLIQNRYKSNPQVPYVNKLLVPRSSEMCATDLFY